MHQPIFFQITHVHLCDRKLSYQESVHLCDGKLSYQERCTFVTENYRIKKVCMTLKICAFVRFVESVN